MDINSLGSMGFSMPTPAYLFGMLLFSLLGFAAYRYGKTTSRPKLKWIGVVMMFYTYLVDATWLMYTVGTILCIGAYIYRGQED